MHPQELELFNCEGYKVVFRTALIVKSSHFDIQGQGELSHQL